MSGEDEAKPKPEGKKPDKADDVVFVHSPTERGDGFRVVRKRADAIEVGEIRALAEGRPVHGEVVKLTPREEHAQLFDVDVLVPPAEAKGEGARSGPPQVATDAYRKNWDAIFGAPPDGSKLN